MKIWVYAISKNERQFCERFMASCKEADGVSVLDTGSEDGTADYFPDIVFNPNDADFGKLAPICETYAGGVYIYASEQPGATVNIVSASFIRAAT